MKRPTAAPIIVRQAPETGESVWHALGVERVLSAQRVDEQHGLDPAEVTSRTQQFDPNAFAAGKVESRWHAFGRQYAGYRSCCWSPVL